ncbi:MAG: META domain-containing protein [Silicimonas sp.]|nr:META domain-containing protein [Silicimonas sp.]
MWRVLVLSLVLPFAGCADETVSGYADPDAVYVLAEIDGKAFDARASISFPETGRAFGEAPCNRWSADQTAPYPWLALGPIAATRRACLAMADEQVFFAALADMTLVEVQGDTLILSSEDGTEMIFRAE